MNLLVWLLLLALLIWAYERFYLRGKKPASYPVPQGNNAIKRFSRPEGPGPELISALKDLRQLALNLSIGLKKHDIKASRESFDAITDDFECKSEFIACDAGGVPAEWVIAPGADKDRRVLYIHGGGFLVGSPKSHRTITHAFSEVSGCAVLAIDYRMMPEFKHQHCVEDCRTAYQWILENGPDGPSKTRQLFIGGDSAGGNLTLSLIAWIRDNKQQAPAAAVVFSPVTDVTFSGPSFRSNHDTDHVLKSFLKPLVVMPSFIKSWTLLWTYKTRPCNPVPSPLFGDLSDLPPILVQASETEMLLDDARRYVYKACASGTNARLQTWDDMPHVWQIFYPQLPQAVEAWNEVGKFLAVIPAKAGTP
jgi:monoterpene epsilon-lactone hydrolase